MVDSAKPIPSTWCPGCGDFGALAALKRAMAELKIPPHEAVLVGGIGCSGGIHNFLEINGLHALHGRLLAQAVGVKLANPKLNVVAVGGDGDGYAIGMGHFMHAFKKNASILYLVMMNETYGLTKGQAAPTAPLGYEGNIERPFDAILAALSQQMPNFVARTFSGDPKTLTRVLVEALEFNRANRGFAFIEDLSPCVTYNDTFKEWREKVLDLSTLPGYDATDRATMFRLYLETLRSGRIPIGVMHRPPPAAGEVESLELKLLPDRIGPAVTGIELEPNRETYQKLLAAVG
ncbi:MAG: thiamine pyrophosphate-dependent enzyme [Thermoplasmata archaeon]|nr:thiamine pyrophosphate-dependent enzyme [Thermoplasmata archaeon]MCI4342168.1 thiamine pyrophosphate-dependent enzyme [Thermoplasmata archaeon]